MNSSLRVCNQWEVNVEQFNVAINAEFNSTIEENSKT